MDKSFVVSRCDESIALKQRVRDELSEVIFETGNKLIRTLKNGNKVLFCGNGGSAADAQHFAAELIVKLKNRRRALPGLALTTDSSVMTAIANDFSADEIFSRQVEGLGSAGDLLVTSSTTGNSKNLIQAVSAAKEIGIQTIGLLGGDGGKLAAMVDNAVVVPSSDTQRIQECHLLIGHIWMEMIDAVY